MSKSDIEIAREATLKPITEIGEQIGVSGEALQPYGHTKAKLSAEFISRQRRQAKARPLPL
jgi:formate--tetrahydrofolate ligase